MRLALLRWFAAWVVFLVLVGGGGLDLHGETNVPTQGGAKAGETMAESRLNWRMETIVGAYRQAGHTNSAWDDAAIQALTAWAHRPEDGSESKEILNLIISKNCRAATAAGCDDPLIRYLSLLYAGEKGLSREERVAAFCKMAQEMDASSYLAVRKFHAWYWAAKEIHDLYGSGAKVPKDLKELQTWDNAFSRLETSLVSEKLPPAEAYTACYFMLTLYGKDKVRYPRVYEKLEKNFPKGPEYEAMDLLLKGHAYSDMAWQAKGNSRTNGASNEGGQLFEERLKTAAGALTRAWELDPNEPRIAMAMMRVEFGQHEGRPRMELWFRRAMALDPNCYDACVAKLKYLDPKWGGSSRAMLEFGRECVTNKNWGGNVPLTLFEAHRMLCDGLTNASMKSFYWRIPNVWLDVQNSYERYFEVNPTDTKSLTIYSLFAFETGHWREFNAMASKIDPADYEMFGGKEKFDKLVAEAGRHAGK
jgi:hypothetical protein